jgi:hypothetical protein
MEPAFSSSLTDTTYGRFLLQFFVFIHGSIYILCLHLAGFCNCDHRFDSHCVVLTYYFQVVVVVVGGGGGGVGC